MTDSEIVDFIRLLSLGLNRALSSMNSADTPKAKAEINVVQEGLDQIAYELRKRDPLDETMH